nr:putative chloride channel protein [uncultured bacterium]
MLKPNREFLLLLSALLVLAYATSAQPGQTKPIRTVTIPISIFTKQELKERRAEEFVQADTLIVREDNEEQTILSIRSVTETPLSIAIVIQEDLSSGFNLQLKDIADFIRGLPRGTRVMVAYAKAGSPQVTQRFTDDLDTAAKSLRIVTGNAATGPRNPYESVQDIVGRFDALPAGRRAILLFSDGLDATGGLSLASVSQSFDLDQAILKAQRRSVAVYSFYHPTPATENGNSVITLGAQGALQKLSDETGGRAFFNGSIAPVSFLPFFKDLSLSLNRQFALTYVTTHMNKGYHKVNVNSTNPEVKIEHPKGYYYR